VVSVLQEIKAAGLRVRLNNQFFDRA